jgi:hypothetical protein
MGIQYNPRIVTDGLVLALDAGNTKSYPGSGTAWTDLSGRGNTGTLVNSPAYSSVNGGSLLFNGTSNYATLPANSINTNANLTLNYWVKSPLPGTGLIYTLSSGYTAISHLQVRYVNTAGVVSVQLVNSTVANMGSFSGFTPVSNAIYFLTVTLTKSTNTWSLYVNGSFVSSFVSAQTFTTTQPSLGINAGPGSEERFAGNFYTFSYYNRVLSATEISQNFNALRGRYGI